MKVSLNWLRDYVELPQDMDLKRLAYDLTMSTVEVEDATDLGASFHDMVVGEIREVLPHPNADKLRICRTDIGGGDIREIVCGGSNLRDGMKVAVALPGAFCRWHGEGEPVEIKKSKLRGVDSYGMICGAVEIGLDDLFPADGEAVILDLSDFDAPAGTPLADALELNDVILEIDNKSMTNRPDLWGHYGIARELAALYHLPMKEFPRFDRSVANTAGFHVTVEDAERCPRYLSAQIEGLSVKPAPYQMQSRIWRVGMRPINALVDITNYVMLATGQPTHAFDSDHIAGHVIVRRAGEGEKLLLLNGKELTLTADDLTIADDAGIVGLAGVMGGAKDSILPETDKVILEVANFQAAGIRRTALRYDNRTEASARYEKAIDPERCDQAFDLSMQLFRELYPEMQVTGLVDQYPVPLKNAEIDVPISWLERRLGKTLTPEDVAHKLEPLGFRLTFDGDNMHVVAPTWRSTGDVSIKADIMEEVARMYGYENFEAEPITTPSTAPSTSWTRIWSGISRSTSPSAAGCRRSSATRGWRSRMSTPSSRAPTASWRFLPRRLPPSALSAPHCCPTCARRWPRTSGTTVISPSLRRRRCSTTRTTPPPTIPVKSCPPSARMWPVPSCPPARTWRPCSARPRAWWR